MFKANKKNEEKKTVSLKNNIVPKNNCHKKNYH